MRAQWVWSRERRMALYKRSSINHQSINYMLQEFKRIWKIVMDKVTDGQMCCHSECLKFLNNSALFHPPSASLCEKNCIAGATTQRPKRRLSSHQQSAQIRRQFQRTILCWWYFVVMTKTSGTKTPEQNGDNLLAPYLQFKSHRVR